MTPSTPRPSPTRKADPDRWLVRTGSAVVEDHINRYAQYAAVGVHTSIVNLPGAPDAEDVAAFGPLISAFAQ